MSRSRSSGATDCFNPPWFEWPPIPLRPSIRACWASLAQHATDARLTNRGLVMFRQMNSGYLGPLDQHWVAFPVGLPAPCEEQEPGQRFPVKSQSPGGTPVRREAEIHTFGPGILFQNGRKASRPAGLQMVVISRPESLSARADWRPEARRQYPGTRTGRPAACNAASRRQSRSP